MERIHKRQMDRMGQRAGGASLRRANSPDALPLPKLRYITRDDNEAEAFSSIVIGRHRRVNEAYQRLVDASTSEFGQLDQRRAAVTG
jgi:hypothetical protein